MQSDTKIRVGILRGGVGEDYASSLRQGGDLISHILENLSERYKPVDVLVDRGGVWHVSGVPVVPADLMHKVDVVWNTSHPSFLNILDSLAVPYIGASSFLHSLENNREMLREHMKDIGVFIPRQVIGPKNAREVFEKFASPWIVKNGNEIRLAKTFDQLAQLVNGQEDLIVEEFITGTPVSTHSVAGFRGEDVYVFPVLGLKLSEKEKLSRLIEYLHNHLNASHYLKSDFILSPNEKVYLLSIDSAPDLRENSHFHQVCQSVGAKMHHVVEHILQKVL